MKDIRKDKFDRSCQVIVELIDLIKNRGESCDAKFMGCITDLNSQAEKGARL